MKKITLLLIVLICVNINAQCWRSASAGQSHSLAIKTDGTLWSWGNNSSGQLGDGTLFSKPSPNQVGVDSNWKYVSSGGASSLAIKTDGTLWAWGYNCYGQIGDGSLVDKTSPIQIGSGTNWDSVETNGEYTIAIKTNGTLWAWGRNNEGQLGDGTLIDKSSPTQIGNSINWASFGVGSNFNFAIKTNGTLWSWGHNSSGLNVTSPLQIGIDSNWSSVASGNGFSLSIKTDGTLWSWGYNSHGQLGDGTLVSKTSPIQVGVDSNWASIKADTFHSFAIKTDGTLWAWGANYLGNLGDGTTIDRNLPTQIGNDSNWVSISTEYSHSFAIKTDGTLWSWGNNSYGMLGVGTQNNSTFPILVTNVVYNASSSPTLCVNTALANLYHTVTGTTTGIGVPLGLPAGVGVTFLNNIINISGTPTASGIYNYSIPVIGLCGNVINATGTITVKPNNSVSAASSSPTLCINSTLTNIIHNTTGVTGLYSYYITAGVSATFTNDTITISGTPTSAGIFNYSIPLSGGCGNLLYATGTIIVKDNYSVDTASSSPTICVNADLTNITHTTTGATGIGLASGLPAGVSATFVGNNINVSGTPTTAGIFNYSIPLTGGCGNANAVGIIIVNPVSNPTFTQVSPICAGVTLDPLPTSSIEGIYGIWSPELNNTSTTDYLFTPIDNQCASIGNMTVIVNLTTEPNGNILQNFTQGQTLTNLQVTGTNLIWYANQSDAINHVNPILNTTLLVNGSTYYVTQTNNGCESSPLAITVNVALGINDFQKDKFVYYPNPVSNVVNFENNNTILKITLFNLIGQRVEEKEINSLSGQLDMSKLPIGNYLLKFKTDNGESTIKLVKN